MPQEILETLLEAGINEDNVEVVSLFEFEEDVASDVGGQEDCSGGLAELAVADLADVFGVGHGRGF